MDENELVLENNRFLNKWVLRLAAELQSRYSEYITEMMLYTPFELTLSQWRQLLIYDIQTKYEVNMIHQVLFDPEYYGKEIYLDFEAVSAKKEKKVKLETFEWFKKMPSDILMKYGVRQDIDAFGDLLSDDYAQQQTLDIPPIPQEFIKSAKEYVYKFFLNMPLAYLSDNQVTKTEEDFKKLLEMDLISFELLSSLKLSTINW
ncbi:hypothetical protein [Lactobacillus taiwanensis]|jgi:hypothetical protein|uniref:hypothetical protein n=2 Tax=Lactobacillus taiwanensis TaxID=508451 RepID=UPI0024309FB8|nr:hypothetical protein [Lactobacillus taiwanensis]